MLYTDQQGRKYDDSPVTREPKQVMCRHCKTRAVISDGHGNYIHEDNYRYSCNPDPKAKHTTFAEVRI